MSSSSERPVTLFISHAPGPDPDAAEMALALAAFDLNTQVVFRGAGVFWLLPQQEARKEAGKAPHKVLSAFPLYGIDTLLCCRSDLNAAGLSPEQLLPGVTVLEPEALAKRLQQSGHCLTF